jgi:hypothetical protein
VDRVNSLRRHFWFEHYRDFIRAAILVEVNLKKEFINSFIRLLKVRLLKDKFYRKYYEKNIKKMYKKENLLKGPFSLKTKLLLILR